VFENRELRRLFRPKREEVAGGWKKKLCNEDLHSLYPSPYFIVIIKSRKVRWIGHVTYMGR
jgi:hypothetical protein